MLVQLKQHPQVQRSLFEPRRRDSHYHVKTANTIPQLTPEPVTATSKRDQHWRLHAHIRPHRLCQTRWLNCRVRPEREKTLYQTRREAGLLSHLGRRQDSPHGLASREAVVPRHLAHHTRLRTYCKPVHRNMLIHYTVRAVCTRLPTGRLLPLGPLHVWQLQCFVPPLDSDMDVHDTAAAHVHLHSEIQPGVCGTAPWRRHGSITCRLCCAPKMSKLPPLVSLRTSRTQGSAL